MTKTAREIGQSLFPAPGREKLMRDQGVLKLLEGTPGASTRRSAEAIEDYARAAAIGDTPGAVRTRETPCLKKYSFHREPRGRQMAPQGRGPGSRGK